MITGTVKGSLGKKLDAKLGLSKKKHGSKYVDWMLQREVGGISIQEKESEDDKAPRKACRKVCKSEGCGKFAWNGGGGHCYDHADLSKRMCCKCNNFTRKYAGGVCVHCREPSIGEQEKQLCRECGARPSSVKLGSRCKKCFGSSFSGRKAKKAKRGGEVD